MKFEKKYAKILGITLSFPSFILAMAFGTYELIKAQIVSKLVGWSLFILVLGNFLFLLVRYAFMNKKK